MDTKRLYVDFHVLQTVPPSCVNRDDTGSPKTAVYGGAVRARVSSQAWKHAMRVMFTEEMSDAVETGYRTKKGTDLVAEQIKALAPDKDALKLAQKVIADAGIKSDDKGTKALFFMSTAQAKALAELAVEGCKDKKQYKEALKAAPSADMALFGRMVAGPVAELRRCRTGGPQHLHPHRAERVRLFHRRGRLCSGGQRRCRASGHGGIQFRHPVPLCDGQCSGAGAHAGRRAGGTDGPGVR